MDKKYIIIIVLVVALVGVLIGYLLTGNTDSKTTELTFVSYNEEEKNFAKAIKDFEKQNNLKIKFVKKDPKNYELDSLNLISTGKIDVWGIPNTWLPKHLNKLSTFTSANANDQKLLENYKNAYPNIVVSENVTNDKIYGFPVSLDALVLFSNNQLRTGNIAELSLTRTEQEALLEIPTNWTDLAAQVKILSAQKSQNQIESGLAIGSEETSNTTDILTAIMLQNGTQMTSEDNIQATFHTATNKFGGEQYPGAQSLKFYTGFANRNDANYSFADTISDPLRAFATGKVTYYIGYSSDAKDIARISPNFNYSIEALPQVKETKYPVNFVKYETFTVPKSSPNQIKAWEFVNFLTNSANLEDYYNVTQNNLAIKTQLASSGGKVALACETAASWHNPDPIETDKIFRQAIGDVLNGQNAQTVLDGAALQVTSLLKNLKE